MVDILCDKDDSVTEETIKYVIEGGLNQTELCQIRNLSNEDHKYAYWDELGFREYELNRKHGNREYYRCGGKRVVLRGNR